MKFRTRAFREEPEINFIPLTDVLLVILIFLMVTTTYSRFAELQINLPTADVEKQLERPNEVSVLVDAQGRYVVNRTPVSQAGVEGLAEALKRAADGAKTPVVVISADAKATHDAVVRVMWAAQTAGLGQITFTTQGTPK